MRKLKLGILATLLVILSAAGVFAMGEKFGSHKENTFRFEDYDTDAEAQTALLKLHPVGSDIFKSTTLV